MNINDIAANSAQPCFVLPTILPKVRHNPPPIRKMEKICTQLESGVGFSSGCAELALKMPPPFVPCILIDSCEATGPCAILCAAPSTVFTSVYGAKFWG